MSVEDEALRGKVMVAIHAARANALHEEHLQSKVGRAKGSKDQSIWAPKQQ